MDHKKTSLLVEMLSNVRKQLLFIEGELSDSLADHLVKECGFHEDVRGHISNLRKKGGA